MDTGHVNSAKTDSRLRSDPACVNEFKLIKALHDAQIL